MADPTAATTPGITPPASGAPASGATPAPPPAAKDAPPAAAGAATTDAGAPPAGAEPKAAASRALLKEQEAKRRFEAERAKLADERARLLAESSAKEKAMREEFKKNPMAFAKKYDVTYEEITKAAIADVSANTPEARIAALEAERKAEKEAADKAAQATAAQQQRAEVEQRIATYVGGVHDHALKGGTAYAMTAALDADYAKSLIRDVADLMADEGHAIPSAAEVCDKIEAYLESEHAKLAEAKAKKTPAPAAPAPAATAPAEGISNADVAALIAERKARNTPRPPPRNLTNKDTAAPTPKNDTPQRKMSRDEAIAHVAELARAGKLA